MHVDGHVRRYVVEGNRELDQLVRDLDVDSATIQACHILIN